MDDPPELSSAVQLLHRLRSRGIYVRIVGGRLIVHPGEYLDDADRMAIRELAPAIAALSADQGGPPRQTENEYRREKAIDEYMIRQAEREGSPAVEVVEMELVTIPGLPPKALPAGRWDEVLRTAEEHVETMQRLREAERGREAEAARRRLKKKAEDDRREKRKARKRGDEGGLFMRNQ